MKRKPMLVELLGGPKRIVQHVVTGPKTITVCPLCQRRFKDHESTVLVDLVKRLGLTESRRSDPEFTVRIHVCRRCAEPIVQQKREAMSKLISAFAKLALEDVLRELEQEARADPSEKNPGVRQRKPRNPQR